MIGIRPYFMNNKNWYRFDNDQGVIVLTKDAPLEAVKSYKDFYKKMDEDRNSAKGVVLSVLKDFEKEKRMV